MSTGHPETLTADDFPQVAETAHGTVTRELVDVGLTLLSTLRLATGETVTSRISWIDLDCAQIHYADSVAAFDRRLPDLAEQARSLADGARDHSTLRRCRVPGGRLSLFTNTSPPTWWLPRAGIGLRHKESGHLQPYVKIGWLRLAVVLTFEPGKRR